ncbi:MAG: class I SAM-dependent RNA methyltransferase [Alphaproteobacteria bacterium]|nr:class I SAM-dependent RNA methyltransferase [Alphaproteobacteria bacterium]
MKTRKLKNHPPVSVEIREIGAKGDGVGTYNNRPVYVGKAAKGDRLLVNLETEREDGYTARLLSVEAPGPERAAPPCIHYARCGGCSLQHVTQQFYRDWKTAKVKNALARAGVEAESWEESVFLPHATRRRATLGAYSSLKELRFGYFEARSDRILDILDCLVVEPALDAKLKALREFLPRLLPANTPADLMLQNVEGVYDMVLTGAYQTRGRFSLQQDEAMAELTEKLDIARISFREEDTQKPEPVITRKAVIKNFGGINVQLPPGAFLQASAAGEAALVSVVLKYAAGAKNIADLFSGCGTFAGSLLRQGKVYACESDAAAINALGAAKHKDLTATRRDLFKNPLTAKELNAFDAVVFDPPRVGASAQSAQLAQSEVPNIIAVSCNPATFARDAKMLREGGYNLRNLTLVDQFIWSAHVELVALFTR